MKRMMLIAAVFVLVLSPVNAAADFTTCYPVAATHNTGSTDGATKTRPSEIAGHNTEHGWAMFDTSAIPDTHTIAGVALYCYVNSTYYPYWSVTPVTSDPLTATPADLYADIDAEAFSGYYLYRSEDPSFSTGWKAYLLGGTANGDLQAGLAGDSFTLGVATRDYLPSFYIGLDGWSETNAPYLVVEHSLSTCDDAMVDLGTMGCGDVLWHSGDTTGETNYCGYPSGDHFIKFEVLENGLYTFDMCFYSGTLFDTVLWLFDDECCGNVIAVNDDDIYGCGSKSRIDVVLSPGTYFAQVEGYGADEGLYEILISCQQPVDLGPVPCFEEIIYDNDTSGAIDFCGNPAGDLHCKFTVDYTAEYSISTCYPWTTYDSALRLYDDYSCGNPIAFNDDYAGCSLTSRIDVTLDPGDYYAQVEGFQDNEGPFEMHISCNPPGGDTEIRLEPNMECYEQDDTVYLAITLSNGNAMIVGGQFFLGYDNTALDFETITVGDSPFTNEIYRVVDEVAGTIDYAVGVPEGDPGTIYNTVMAYLTFTALRDICYGDGLVNFRAHSPPSRLSDNYGNPEHTILVEMDIDDTTPPVISCPGPLTLECDLSTDPSSTGWATATDNCDPTPEITWSDVLALNGCGGYTGTITRTWQAMDHCDNAATCDQLLTVVDTTAPALTPGSINACYPTEAAAEAAAMAATGAVDNCTDPGSLVFTASTVDDCAAVITVTVTDQCGNANLTTYNTRIDNTAPVVTAGSDLNVNADFGLCSAVVTWPAATAVDNCDGPIPGSVLYDIDLDNNGSVDSTQATLTYTFASGTHKVTAHATDFCSNTGADDFLVTVSGDNEMVVDLTLSPTISNSTDRCITFELYDCSGAGTAEIVQQVISFDAGGGMAAPVTVLVPCGVYTCVTARDALHTLRRTTAMGSSGTKYVANFSNPLIGGNLNNDCWIDILDFGVFSLEWNTDYGTGDTDCSSTYPNADIDGDAIVDSDDFTFIRNNFLDGNDPNCCCMPSPLGPESHPVISISVEQLQQLGLGQLALGDLNGDAVLDQADMIAFMQGARPSLKPKQKEGISLHE